MARIVKETVAETKTCQWYDGLGLQRLKLNVFGRRGFPDQEFFVPGGKPFLIEFKADGEEPRKLQAYIIKQLKEAGYDVETHTSAEEAIAAIKIRLARAGWRPDKQGRAVEPGTVPDRSRQLPAGPRVRRTVSAARAAKD